MSFFQNFCKYVCVVGLFLFLSVFSGCVTSSHSFEKDLDSLLRDIDWFLGQD